MSTPIADLVAKIRLDTSEMDRALDATERRLSTFGAGLTTVGIGTGFAVVAEQAVALTAALAPAAGAILAIPAAAGVAAAGLGTLIVGLHGVGGALKAAFSDTGGGGGGGGQSAAARQLQLASAAKAVETAQRGVALALRGVADAHAKVAEAVRGVESAQKRAQSAQEALTQAREDATRALKSYQDQLVGAAADEEGADIARLEAQKHLHDLVAQGVTDTLILRKARNDVTQAELRYREVAQANLDLQAKASKAQKDGVEGDANVVAAKDSVAQANQNVADANDKLAKAQQGVVDAQDAVVRAQRDVADAMLAAQVAAEKTSGGVDKFGLAMSKLSPNAQAFVRSIIGLKSAWAELTLAIQDHLFAGLGVEIQRVAATNLPTLRAGSVAVADSLNRVAISGAEATRSPIFQGALVTIFGATRQATDQFASAVGPLTVGIANLAAAGTPLVLRFTEFVTNGLRAAGAFLSTQEGADRMRAVMQRAGDVIGAMWKVAVNLGVVLKNIFQVADVNGFLNGLVGITAKFAEFTSSAEGKKDIGLIFGTLQQVAERMGAALPILAQALVDVLGAVNSMPGPVKDLLFQFLAWSLVIGPLVRGLAGVSVAIKGVVDVGQGVGGAMGIVAKAFDGTALAAVKSGIETGRLWLMYTVDSARAAASMAVVRAQVVGHWIAMQLAATANALKTAGAWAVTAGTAAAGAVAATAIAVASIVGGWVLMGVQALAAAARVALAWIIAMGPIALVIAVVIGLVILIIKNWDTIRDVTVAVWNAVVGFLVGVWDWIWAKVSGVVSTLRDWIVGAWNFVHDRTVAAFNGIRDAIGGAITTAVNLVVDLPGRIVRGLGNIGSFLFEHGKSLIQGLIDGMGVLLKDIGKFMADRLPAIIRDPFKKALGISSPSKVFAEYGRNIGQGVIVGLASTQGEIAAAMGTMRVNLTNGLDLDSLHLNPRNLSPSTTPFSNSAAGGTTVINNFNTQVDASPFEKSQVGQVVTDSLKRWELAYLPGSA